MKILHCCLAAFYIDNFSYQENIFPKIHKLQGHQVHIIASTETYLENIEFTPQNELYIRQIASLSGAERSSGNLPVEIRYYLSPYEPDTAFVPSRVS